MEAKPVMVKTYLNQPVVRFLLRTDSRGMEISDTVDGSRGVWAVDPSQVYELDTNLFQRMAAFDDDLDNQPEGLIQLWDLAKHIQI